MYQDNERLPDYLERELDNMDEDGKHLFTQFLDSLHQFDIRPRQAIQASQMIRAYADWLVTSVEDTEPDLPIEGSSIYDFIPKKKEGL